MHPAEYRQFSRPARLCRALSVKSNADLSTYRMINEQAARISGCALTFYADRGNRELIPGP